MEITNNNHETLDDKLFSNRIIPIFGEITNEMASVVIAKLLYLDSVSSNDITLYINSPGGAVTDGLAIYDTMKSIKSDVATIAVGQALSMGAFLLSSGTKGKRYALPSAEIMIHQPSGGALGKASDIKIAAARIDRHKKRLNTILANNTGKTYEIIEKDTKDDFFMDANEALEYGIIDQIIKDKKELQSNKVDIDYLTKENAEIKEIYYQETKNLKDSILKHEDFIKIIQIHIAELHTLSKNKKISRKDIKDLKNYLLFQLEEANISVNLFDDVSEIKKENCLDVITTANPQLDKKVYEVRKATLQICDKNYPGEVVVYKYIKNNNTI